MPAARMNLRMIKELLRLKYEARLSHQQIALALRISKGGVAKYVGLAEAAGLNFWVRMTTQVDRRCRRVLTAMSTMMTGGVEKF